MLSYFQKYYSFKGIMFSRSPLIIELCNRMNVTVIDHYLTNPYNMPLIRDLFQQAYHTFSADFYGYANSDVIMDVTIFSVLKEVKRRIDNKRYSGIVEISGRVYDTKSTKTLNPTSLDSFREYLKVCMKRSTELRNRDSAVCACVNHET